MVSALGMVGAGYLLSAHCRGGEKVGNHALQQLRCPLPIRTLYLLSLLTVGRYMAPELRVCARIRHL